MYIRNWERGHAVSFLGISVSNFRYSVFAVCHTRHAMCKIKQYKSKFGESTLLKTAGGGGGGEEERGNGGGGRGREGSGGVL
jgi:hypothetical protein